MSLSAWNKGPTNDSFMLNRLDRFGSIAAALILACGLLQGQKGEGETKFEVASIKTSAPQLGRVVRTRITGGPGTGDPGRFSTENFSLFYLLSSAYDLKRYEIAAPQWTETALFDVSANVSKGASKAQFRLMLQDMLIERFKLETHWEKRESTAYQLVLKPGTAKWRLSEANERDKNSLPTGAGQLLEVRVAGSAIVKVNGNYRLQVAHETMKQLAARLSQELRVPVDDATGLSGAYDLTMTWSRDETRGSSGLDPNATRLQTLKESDGNVAPGIFTAIQEQLGLKLISKKALVDVLVVDKVNKLPTDN